ncbi:hypothetical protein DFH28DRAFT_888353, partial [Melampsora americana]
SPDTFVMSYPLRALVIEDHLHKFLEVADRNARMPQATVGELVEILALFHPGLRLDSRTTHRTALQLFNILVRPFIQKMESFDEVSNTMHYWDVGL